MKFSHRSIFEAAIDRAARRGRITDEQRRRLKYEYPVHHRRAYENNNFREHQFLFLWLLSHMRRDGDVGGALALARGQRQRTKDD